MGWRASRVNSHNASQRPGPRTPPQLARGAADEWLANLFADGRVRVRFSKNDKKGLGEFSASHSRYLVCI